MQHTFILITFMLCNALSYATDNEIKLKTEIAEVTVYQQNALVHRAGKIAIPKGNSSVIINELNQNIRPQDVKITAKGDFTILSISHRYHVDTISGKSGYKMQQEINARIQKIQQKITRENGYLDIFNKEEQMLLNNQNFTHKEEGVDIDRLAKASDFLRNRLFDIKQKRLEISDTDNLKLKVLKQKQH